MMIKIRDDLYLAAGEITAVEIDSNGSIVVHTGAGGRHMPNDYGKGAYATVARINAEISAARSNVEKKLDTIIAQLARASDEVENTQETPNA